MLRAHTTGLLQPFAELLPGPMMPHAQIVGGDPKFAGNGFQGFVAEIEAAD